MTDLLELAERCEASTGPDQALDRDIQRAVAPDDLMQHYTASLDAAMTLVPEGWWGCIEQERPTRDCEASLSPPVSEPWGPRSINTSAATPALTLCAAALRARAAMSEDAK